MSRYALIGGYEILIDQNDMEKIATFGPWSMNSSKKDKAKGRLYFAHNLPEVNGKRKCVKLHRIIAGATEWQTVDHRNGNTLDCRKENLRIVDTRTNVINAAQAKENRGITYEKKKKLWRARIQVFGKSVSLGRFKQLEDANEAYRKAENEYGYSAIRERRMA